MTPKEAQQLVGKLAKLHTNAQFSPFIPTHHNGRKEWLMRIWTNVSKDAVQAWFKVHGFEADVRPMDGGYAVAITDETPVEREGNEHERSGRKRTSQGTSTGTQEFQSHRKSRA